MRHKTDEIIQNFSLYIRIVDCDRVKDASSICASSRQMVVDFYLLTSFLWCICMGPRAQPGRRQSFLRWKKKIPFAKLNKFQWHFPYKLVEFRTFLAFLELMTFFSSSNLIRVKKCPRFSIKISVIRLASSSGFLYELASDALK